jgi:16S rRNA (cytosine967-C5)-methyltransferase
MQPKRNETVVDFCAGAGGKTLALGAMMRNTGRLYAMDTSAHRLDALKPRAQKSGINEVHTMVLAHEQDQRLARMAAKVDRVLVDAPCSGLGTLRRNPDLQWRLSLQDLEALQALQLSIVQSAAKLVKPGGRLVYATCSLLTQENEAVAQAFEQGQRDWVKLDAAEVLQAAGVEAAPNLCRQGYLRLWPHRHHTDGFFAAVWQRKA